MRKQTSMGMLAATMVTLVITGCGESGGSAAPDIATLRSAEAPAASSPAVQDRPVIRPDASADDIAALERVYFKCLDEAGVPVAKSADGEYGKPKDPGALADKPAARACAAKQPESWLDRERRDNPEFVDRLRDAVACLKDKGFKARLDGDPPQIRYSSTREFMRAGDAETECQKEAFSARIRQLYQG
jgi:hypothetical protein